MAKDFATETRDANNLSATLTLGNNQTNYSCVKTITQLGISGDIITSVYPSKSSYTNHTSEQVLLNERNNKLKITYFVSGSPIYLLGRTSCNISKVNGQLQGVVNPGNIIITSSSIIGEENDGI
jgi:hypothetical protein